MNNAELQLRGVGDPRLAMHATGAFPAWLWSLDGSRLLWANPVGAALFGAPHAAALAQKTFGPADPLRRQIAQLAPRLPANGATRLQRLRGFGAPLGRLVTCSCARLEFADGSHAVLIAAAEPVGRAMPLIERLLHLVEGIDAPVAAFARDGMFVGASDAARPLLDFRNLSAAGLDAARIEALKLGRAETAIGARHLVLQRIGVGPDVALVALIAPARTAASRPAMATAPRPVTDAPVSAWSPAPAVAPDEPAAPDRFAAPAAMPGPPQDVQAEPQFEDSTPQPIETALPRAEAAPPADMSAADLAEAELAEAELLRGHALLREAAPAASLPSSLDAHDDEPSPFVESVADEPASAFTDPAANEVAPFAEQPAATSGSGDPLQIPRPHPLRFMWQMDADGRFLLGSDEFTRLIGARTAAGFGRPWSEITEAFGLDPDGRVLKACATRETWSGIILNWPVDDGSGLQVELSGLPMFDPERNFAGYRGFGVCRDLDGLTRLAFLRHHELLDAPPTLESTIPAPTAPAGDTPAPQAPADETVASRDDEPPALPALETSPQPDLETTVETPKNILPFRPASEQKSPVLSQVESSAFNELARQLAARLESEDVDTAVAPETPEPQAEPPQPAEIPSEAAAQPGWLARPEPPARGEFRDRTLLDLLPVGVLIYRLDRLVYANPAFLERIGYRSLQDLEDAGGLDALYVEPGVPTTSSTSNTGTPVRISASETSLESETSAPSEARLFTISWEGDSALALIFSSSRTEPEAVAAVAAPAPAPASAPPVPAPSPVGHANAEELGAILDTAAEGIVMFDAEGNINSCNPSAEALFGYDGAELTQRNLAELFAPESRRAVLDYLESVRRSDAASLLDHGREALGSVRGGGLIPLSMTMGRTRPDGPNFFAVFRDLSQTRKSESDLQQARRLTDRAASAKADMLARISHEIRTPLNAIIGFAEVMIGERFGALGNERYVEYMKDIRASGERVTAIIDDLLDLSRIETGKLDLAFTSQNLNDMVEQCVSVMQPQANRERIIIRTSLAHTLPPVVADARALRQIALNLIGNSIHLANPGGQVIVSTALSDFGEVVLRVRDTGLGLNDNEVAAAMEPFRTEPPSDRAAEGSAVSLSLTRALVEANRAQFQIKAGSRSGTLIEVVFSHATAKA